MAHTKPLAKIFTFCGKSLGALLAIFGGNEALKASAVKIATEKLQRATDDIIGSSVAQAEKDVTDECYLELLLQLGDWSKNHRVDVESFRDRLWSDGGEEGKRTGEQEKHAFTLAIAKMMLTASEALGSPLSTSKGGNGKKKKPAVSKKRLITMDGIGTADNWIKNLFENHKTFETRRLYIKKFGVFQLIEKKRLGKLQQSLKDGWLATKKKAFLKMAKDLPINTRRAIGVLYDKGCSLATSNTVKNTVVATGEEVVKTARFGAETIMQVIVAFLLVFCLLVSFLSFQKGWLIPLLLCGSFSLTLTVFILRKLFKRKQIPQEG